MNNESVLVRSYGSHSSWTFPEVSNYPDESHLQEILAANPTFIAGVPDRSLTVRELSIGAWFVDVSVVGPDGSLTLVECKLDSNSEPRRMMLGQILDYASAIHLAGFESFLERWKRRGGPNLEDFLDHTALQSLRSNIETGRIHLAFAVDRIDASLQQVIEYLNKVTRDDVMVTALRLSYMRHGDATAISKFLFLLCTEQSWLRRRILHDKVRRLGHGSNFLMPYRRNPTVYSQRTYISD